MNTAKETGINDTVISSLYPADSTWKRDPDDRRRRRRIPLSTSVHYQIIGDGDPGPAGTGRTINISSCGILFTTSQELKLGDRIAVFVDWPVKRGPRQRIELATLARVARRDKEAAAVEILQFDFRKVASKRKARSAPAS